MTIRRIIRDNDGVVLSDETVVDGSLPFAYADLAHTESVDHFVVHAKEGGTIEYRRVPEADTEELELSPDELLREHGVNAHYGGEGEWSDGS